MCQRSLTEFKNMREKALAVDNRGRIFDKKFFKLQQAVDKYARVRAVVSKC